MTSPSNITRVDRPESQGGRYYSVTTTDGVEHKLFSVTNILSSSIAKPALVPWSAKLTAERFADLLTENEIGDFGGLLAIERERIPAFVKEAKAAHRATLTTAGDIGSRVHDYVESLDKGLPLPPVDFDMEPSITAFHQWRDQHHLEIIEAERQVYSIQYGYAGTLDAVARDTETGNLIILDYKTGSGVYKEAALQVAAYAQAFAEMTGSVPDECHVVRFAKDGSGFESRQVADWPTTFHTGFVNVLGQYLCLVQNQHTIWL